MERDTTLIREWEYLSQRERDEILYSRQHGMTGKEMLWTVFALGAICFVLFVVIPLCL